MLDGIEQDIIDNIFKHKIELSALNLAIFQAKRMNISSEKITPLYIKKQQVIKEKKQNEFQALSGMITENVFHLKDNWYAIAYYNKKNNKVVGNRQLLVTPIKAGYSINDISTKIEESNKSNIVKNQKELLNSIKDLQAINDLKIKINRTAMIILEKILSMDDNARINSKDFSFDALNTKDTFCITKHAFNRWCERIELLNNISDISKNADMQKEIILKIRETFDKSKKIYSQKKTSVDFYLDEDSMILFCVKDGNTLVSLWRNNFGFSFNEINKLITLKQIEYINKKAKEIDNFEKKSSISICNLKKEIDNYNNQLEELIKQKEIIENTIKETKLQIEDKNNIINDIENKKRKYLVELKKEENIIFTKYNIDLDSSDNKDSIDVLNSFSKEEETKLINESNIDEFVLNDDNEVEVNYPPLNSKRD